VGRAFLPAAGRLSGSSHFLTGTKIRVDIRSSED
jgi:hypothetical protein